MKLFQIIPAFLLFALTLGSTMNSEAQEKNPGKKGASKQTESKKDPFDAAENPFDNRPKNESVEQKHLRILNSQKESLHYEKSLNLKLKKEIAASNSTSRKLVELVFESIETMFNTNDPAIQTKGLRLFESTLQTIRESSPSADEHRVAFQKFHATLKHFLDSDHDEVRAAVISLFERNLCDSGVRLGYQPTNGFWHPINDSTGEAQEIRSRLEAASDLQFFDEPMTQVLDTIGDFTAIEMDHQHDVDLESVTLEMETKKTTFREILENALEKAKLGYAIRNGKIIIRSLSDEKLKVTTVFNVRGLLTTELDAQGLIKLISVGVMDVKSSSVQTIDKNRIMFVGTEQQLRKVMTTLGQLASTSSTQK